MTDKKSPKIPFIKVDHVKPDLRKKELPLVSLQVTNPVTYLKSWWRRVMGDEGIDFHFKIKPLTAIALAIVFATFGFGVGRFSLSTKQPYIQYVPVISPAPTPTPNPWRQTAFSGSLRFSRLSQRYYLITSASEAISLEIPANVDLSKLIGRRIFATGKYNEKQRILQVDQASDLEVLPRKIQSVPVVTLTVTPTPVLKRQATPTTSRTSSTSAGVMD